MEIRQRLVDGTSINDVCSEYSLSFKELMDMFKFEFKKKSSNSLEYIYKNFCKYTIKKKIEGKGTFIFGSYYDLNDAIKVRNELIACDWNVNPDDYLGDRYIARKNEYYWVFMPKTNEYLKKFKTLDEARAFRDSIDKSIVYRFKDELNEIMEGVE